MTGGGGSAFELGFVLEDPPPPRRGNAGRGGRSKLAEWLPEAVDFARAHPGRWARVHAFAYPPTEAMHRVRRFGLEATSRRVEGQHWLYIRAQGGPRDPA